MRKLLFSIGLLSSISFGQVSYIKKDQPSPYEGYVFSLDSELDNRKKLEQLKTLLIVNDNNQLLLNLKDQYIKESDTEINLWKSQSQDLSKQLVSQENKTFWHSLLYFGLGVASATVMAFAVSHVTR